MNHPPPVSLGSPRFHTIDQGGLLVSDVWFPPNLVLPSHFHDRTVFAMTLSGGWDSVLDRRPRASATGMLLTEPAGERHANHFGSAGAHVVIIQPDASRMSDLAKASGFLTRVNHVRAPEVLRLARRVSGEVRDPDSISPLVVEALGLEMLAAAARDTARVSGRRQGQDPVWLRRVLDYVHSCFLDQQSMKALTTIAGVHPAHLAREFRRHHQTSVGAYVRRLRLDWAADQLLHSDVAIVSLAAQAGFSDQSHFTRAFRRQFGSPPHQFREAQR